FQADLPASAGTGPWASLPVTALIAVTGVDDLLRERDDLISQRRVLVADLRTDLVLEGVQLVDPRHAAAAIERGASRLQRRNERSLVAPAQIRIVDLVDEDFDRFAAAQDFHGERDSPRAPTVVHSERDLVGTQLEAVVDHGARSDRFFC